MSALVILATSDAELAKAWERQLPQGRNALRLGLDGLPTGNGIGLAAIVILDSTFEKFLPLTIARCPTIFVGEPRSIPFEQARSSKRAKICLSYEESAHRLKDLLPLFDEIVEKQSLVEIATERARRVDIAKTSFRLPPADTAELWDFLEGAIESLDTRERLLAEFRRASRHLLRASHAVFFLRETDGFRADRGTSFFSSDDPLVSFFEAHPAIIDGAHWDSPSNPVVELEIRHRLALWGARLLVPIHENGRMLGLIALGVRDDGQTYDESDRNRAVFFARLLRNFLSKSIQFSRLNHLASQASTGARYFPGTIVLAPDENPPRQVPLVVRDIIGQARRTREVCRIAPCAGQPFRVTAGIVPETGGVWAYWEEASGEVFDAQARERVGRREILRELALTLSHEIGNSLVSLATFRQAQVNRPLPDRLIETMKKDVAQLEALNNNIALMQSFHETKPEATDVRNVAQEIGSGMGVRVEVGPDPVILFSERKLLEFTLRSLVSAVADNRSQAGVGELVLKVRSTGAGTNMTALISLKGKSLELEGILPEPTVDSVPNQGRMSVFLAKEILKLHHGEIHAGPGIEGTEILISLRSW